MHSPAGPARLGDGELVPLSSGDSVFRRFCESYGVTGNLLLGSGFILPPIGVLVGALVAGSVGSIAGTLVGLGALLALLNRVTVFGNDILKSRLAGRLALDPDGAEFVGLCYPETNTLGDRLMTVRLETDDNVGFLSLESDALSIRFEEGELSVPRGDIRQVWQQRFIELPYLRWIVIEFYRDGKPSLVHLNSRQCRTLREARASTDRLYGEIIDWYTEPVIAELESRRWGGPETYPQSKSERSSSSNSPAMTASAE